MGEQQQATDRRGANFRAVIPPALPQLVQLTVLQQVQDGQGQVVPQVVVYARKEREKKNESSLEGTTTTTTSDTALLAKASSNQ